MGPDTQLIMLLDGPCNGQYAQIDKPLGVGEEIDVNGEVYVGMQWPGEVVASWKKGEAYKQPWQNEEPES